MKLKEFLEQNNAELIAETAKCKTIEEIEAFAKANGVEHIKEELEEISLKLKEKNALLSDDELDKVSGGTTGITAEPPSGSLYGTPSCPGPRKADFFQCRNCTDLGTVERRTYYGGGAACSEISARCNHR